MHRLFKHSFTLLAAVFCISALAVYNASGQDSHLPYSAGNIKTNAQNEFYRNVEITAGYLPKSGNEGLKANLAVNNLLLQRIGLYTSVEYSFDGKDYANTIGGTVTIFKYVYVWGGVDLLTKEGLFHSGFDGIRKEAGIGITPYKFLVVRIGWSSSVGPSAAAGVRIAL